MKMIVPFFFEEKSTIFHRLLLGRFYSRCFSFLFVLEVKNHYSIESSLLLLLLSALLYQTIIVIKEMFNVDKEIIKSEDIESSKKEPTKEGKDCCNSF